jgi:DNA-binding NtrC family response regulator
MTIALFYEESVRMEGFLTSLTAQGLDVQGIDLNSLRGMGTLDPEINKGVLIVLRHGAGELTAWVSNLLTKSRRLILCAPQPDNEGYRLLKELGADEIITPRTWEPEHISERILAQLIMEGDVAPSACGNLYGATRDMRNLYLEIAMYAPLADPVLILGETGTGKELVAREIHNLSNRPDKFVPINCGELSMELVGSDLFGHKKGSFTGATEARQGLLAEAGRGTIFLDEIGELDLKAQAILLRVLEEKRVRRLGANQSENVPARIVLATNRDLESECEEGRFRQDLFERIRGFTLELKPLRERRADIPLLVNHFLAEFNREYKRTVRLPDSAIDCLFNYEWIGNVRELRAAVRKAATHADASGFLSGWHLLQATLRSRKRKPNLPENAKYYITFDPTVDTWRDFTKRAEAAYFQAIIEAAGGNKKEASRLSGLSLSQFYEKLKSNL